MERKKAKEKGVEGVNNNPQYNHSQCSRRHLLVVIFHP